MRRSNIFPTVLLVLIALLWSAGSVQAQYFGRNKVQYDDFDFKTIKTDNFEIYFYPEERVAVEDAARMAERWYRRHSRTFLREFDERKPLIFYANDADFQQTNVIRGQVRQGTGGFTESLKERVVMPLTGSYRETDHVLGHELVHSFQYDIALRGDTPGFSLRRLPLWLVEGMAEYLSVGRDDPHTAMWLRDAALRDDLPTVEQMTRDMATYFPYRYGQAYSAYIGGKYGDAAVTNLFKLSGRVGVDSAFVYALGITADSLSTEWQQAVKDTYGGSLDGRTPVGEVGRAVIGTPGEKRELNISPALSPDGRYVAFISQRDIFNTNLYVADAETGEVISELESTKSNPHFDALRFINSAGSWSPDGRSFAFVTFVQGDNEINTFDVESGKIQERIAVDGVGAIHNLAWSPDGQFIAFTGIDGGLSNLYVLNIAERTVRQITNDRYAALQPAWSPDGQRLAFTTDRGVDGTNFQTLKFGVYRIGIVDVESREIETIKPFPGGMHHNPQFSPDGRSIFLISDHDGFKDIYRYSLAEKETYRVTALQTGVSGITALSPAMSVAGQSGRMMFSVYSNSGYSIISLERDETEGIPMSGVDSTVTAAQSGRLLPPPQGSDEGLVGSYLNDPNTGLPPPQDFEAAEASNRLRLDRIAPPTVGGGYSQGFGTQVYGGVGLFFSDMLGNQNLDVFLQANGTVKDIGGGGFYTNRKNRLNWGVGAAHIPTLFGGIGVADVNGNGVAERGEPLAQLLQRVFRTSIGGNTSYPLSQTRRFEVSANAVRYGFDIEAFAFTFQGRQEIDPSLVTGNVSIPDPLYLGQVGLAYVGDFSNFGFTSPTQGGRYRVQATPNVGSRDFVNVLLDYRRYFFFNPVTFAVRAFQSGNYGASSDNLAANNFDNLFIRESIGAPYQQAFVRGYSFRSFFNEESCQRTNQCEIDQLFGTRVGLVSAEFRIPLLGTDAFGLVNFPYIPTEFVIFGDAGVAWTNEDLRTLSFSTTTTAAPGSAFGTVPAQPVMSTGVAARMNVLGSAIVEIFYARTFQRDQDWDFGLLLRPGW